MRNYILIAISLSTLIAIASAQPTCPSNLLGYDVCPIWTIPQSFPGGSYVSLQLLDTFQNHIIINSSTNITIEIETIWSQKPIINYTGTHIDFWFNLSEGCNSYTAFIYAPNNQAFTLQPKISAIYDPTPYLTGICNSTNNQLQIRNITESKIDIGGALIQELPIILIKE